MTYLDLIRDAVFKLRTNKITLGEYDKMIEPLHREVEQEPKTEWIPVSERLPDICEKDCRGKITFSKGVLTTQEYGDGFVYVGNDKYTTNNGGGWLSEVPFDDPNECCKVVAWMPLPEPYKMSEIPTGSESEG